ncbi:MAG: TrbI/VirB10 family protein [Verrucomicrobiota bacterium]
MNHRHAINFFKTKPGKFVLFCLGTALAMLFVSRDTQAKQQTKEEKQESLPKLAQKTADPTATGTYSETRSFSSATPTKPSADPALPPVLKEREPDEKPAHDQQPKLLPIKIFFSVKPHPTPPPSPRAPINEDDFYAPFGRMLQCELTLTVDSSTIETPVVGIVTKDLYWNKKLIIPANSEVHGTARTDRVRERIASTGMWTVVLASGGEYPWGTELLLNGIVLDMDLEVNSGRWGISDGSAGLKGVILNNTNTLDEVKLFAATALRGVAEGFIPKTTNLFGQQVPAAGATTAAGQGATAVLDRYAQRIMEEIEQNGFYTRVPAGTPPLQCRSTQTTPTTFPPADERLTSSAFATARACGVFLQSRS